MMKKNVNDQMIREAAYFLWEKAGKPEGDGTEFWIQACAQFYAQHPIKKIVKKKSIKKKRNGQT